MESSMRLRCLLAAMAIFSSYSLMFWGPAGAPAAVAAEATPKVPVGVVLDLASHAAAGTKSLSAISVALEDFYADRPTRVDLHVRDSQGDPATAALAAEDLIHNAQVLAIIAAPQTSAEADLLAELGSRNCIPVLSFSSVSTTLHLHTVPYFVQTSPKDSSQVAPIVDIVTSFLGHEVVIVYEDSPYGIGILHPLTEALQRSSVRKIDSVVVPTGVTDDHFDQMLYRLKDMSARLFVVNMHPSLAVHLFSRAKDAGMVTEDYVWIATSALGNVVDGLSPDDIDNLQGILTLRPYVQGTSLARSKARFHLENLNTGHVHTPSVLLFRAYDTAWATCIAAEIAGVSRLAIRVAETDLSRHGVSANRRALLDSILNMTFDGLTGDFKMVNGEVQPPSYEIVHVNRKGALGVGLWTSPLSLQQKKLSRKGYSFDNRRSVFWREGTSKGREKTGFSLNLDTKHSLNLESKRRNARKLVGGKSCRFYNNKPLRIGVPQKGGFKAFVNVSHPYFFCKDNATRPSTTKQVTGYSIDVFETAMMKLQEPPCYDFCVFDGSYDELVGNVSLGILDGAAGDVTITVNRIGEVDFTMPYTQSGVSLLVLSESDLGPIQWTFLAPLSKGLWFATVGFFFYTGFVVWVIERPRNPEYQGSRLRQFSNALYFAFSTLTFSHAHIIRSLLSKIVVVVWCFLVLVLVQSYTASFSSILTADRLRPTVTSLDQLLFNGDYVGYQHGSFVYSMLTDRGFSKHKLIPYSREDEYADALRKGSMNGGVSAIVDEVPYLTSFLFSDARYQHEFQIVGHIYKTPGLGFVFPLGFPLLHDISTAILNITEGNEGSQMEEKWLGNAVTPPTASNKPSTPLTVRSFSGLFLTSGFISTLMLLISIMRHARRTEPRHGDADRIRAGRPFHLNQTPLDLDLHAVLINPAEPPQEGEFILLNDLQQNEIEQHILQPENEVFLLNPAEDELMQAADLAEDELMQAADDLQQELMNNPLAPPLSPLDNLVGPGEEGFPDHVPIPEDQPSHNQQMILEDAANIDQIIPEENAVPQAMLVDDNQQRADGNLVAQHPQPNQLNNNIQIGMALVRMEDEDPVWNRAKTAEATRLLARFFSSAMGDYNQTLQSGQQLQEIVGSSVTPNSKKRTSKRASAVVETEVIRSRRLKLINNGFKYNGCSDKKSLACQPEPPIIKKEVIKKIAFEFCNLEHSELNGVILQTKRKKML